MKRMLLATAGALALANASAPADAQMNMSGMHMPSPTKKKAPAKKARTNAKKSAAKQATAGREQGVHSQAAGGQNTMPAMTMPMNVPMRSQQDAQSATPPMGEMPMQHGAMSMGKHGGQHMVMSGALGSYPMERESSGTAWQPDTSVHAGAMVDSDGWTLMAHGVLNLVYDHQSGRRGGDKAFASGMLMGMARRPLGNGTVQVKAMLSPDPLMGPRGYPLLLASGETANGRDRLIDRQHPHDFLMELSGSVSQNVGGKSSLFVYAALPGEPAFGPPAFMHREAIMDSPEAPISHHWLDSTHISFGVVTAGIVLDRVKLEISRFNGREPDQHRWDIETGPLDSTAVRLSWNPTRELALQGSWGRFKDPEQLEPGVDQTRWSASLLYAGEIMPGWRFAGTLAWGRRSADRHDDDAYVVEASVSHQEWTVFGRGEATENRELIQGRDEPAYKVGKLSIGAVRDFRIGDHWSVGAGGLVALNFLPTALAPLYGGHHPIGSMAFVRVKFG